MPRLWFPLFVLWLLSLPLLTQPAAAEADAAEAGAAASPISYVGTDKMFIPLHDPGYNRTLIAQFNVGVDPNNHSRMSAKMPIVRGIIMMELQGLTPASTTTPQGVETIRDTVRAALEQQVTDIPVQDLLIKELFVY